MILTTSEKVKSEGVHSNSTIAFSLSIRVAFSSTLEFLIFNFEFSFQRFRFPIVQCHCAVCFAFIANATIDEGRTGSRRKISISAPVSFLKSNRAGITFVLLKNRTELAGRNSVRFEKLEC